MPPTESFSFTEISKMGFGLLTVGYLTLLLFKIVPIELVGFFIIALALDKLEKQERSFRYAKYAAVYLFLESVLSSVMWLDTAAGLNLQIIGHPNFILAENILYHSGLLVFHLLLYYGIRNISKKVGYTKAVARVRVASVATAVFYVGQLCAAFIPGAHIMVLPLAIYQIIWLLFNLFIFMGCYMMIVTDEMLEKEEQKYTEFLEKNNKKRKEQKTTAKKIAENARNSKKPKTDGKQVFRATKK